MLKDIQKSASKKPWAQLQLEFGQILGFGTAVPDGVLEKALKDEKYAAYLMAARNNPKYLNLLFKNVTPSTPPIITTETSLSNSQLITKAGKALVKWGKAGFKTVDDATFDQRMSHCSLCPYLQDAPEKTVYKFKLSKDSDMRICGACGCVAARKAKLTTEQCPIEDTSRRGYNRWGQEFLQLVNNK